jgi:ATP-dependent DNA helicase RecG
MEAMVKTNDGFELSELDLELRGPGEFFGTAQHGLPRLNLANLYRDGDVLAKVRECVLGMFHVEHSDFLSFEPLWDKIEEYLGKIERVSL